MKFVSLHHHSTYSFMDGFGTPAAHIARSAVLGMRAQALTEHGNVSSFPQHEKAAIKAGVQPIFGLEAYTAFGKEERRKFHLTLLAQDQTGYANLNAIVAQSYLDFYQWPTVLGETLAEHSDGIICLSGCADSMLSCSMLGGKSIEPQDASFRRALGLAGAFKELFGDRYYLECQMFPELERTKTLNPEFARMSRKLGVPLVATADVHYPHPDDNEMQVILHAAGRGAGSVDAQAAGWEYDIRLTHPTSDELVLKRLRGAGLGKAQALEALASTGEIADRCAGLILPKAARLRYPLEDERDSRTLIWDWMRDGWRYRIANGGPRLRMRDPALRDEYHARLRHEMRMIEDKDFIDYFLMISDIVRFAKDSGIPVGPARGSAASSLVCYLLRITEIDPLEWPLMFFERFIAPDREDIPDIDLDFDDDRRHEVREYAVRKYGEARVGNIANYVKYKGKNSLDDVGRVFPKIPKSEVERVKGMVIERSGGDSRADNGLQDTHDMFPIVQAVFQEYPDLAKAIRLEGNYRGMSVHAAGLVITQDPIADVCAQYTRTKPDGSTVTTVSVDKKDGEYLGLMKVDLLGLSTMGMIRLALEYAGLTLDDLYAIPMDEHDTMEAFRRNDVIGIFQYEGRATRLCNREVVPDNFLELADINGLSRPGPLFSGTTNAYIDIKHGRKQLEPVHPIWDKVTSFTKGQVIYQEQVLAILRDIGDLPVRRVHEIRKIISQKLGEAQFQASAEDFIAGAARLHGIERAKAEYMWGRLVTSATYSFNIAHCISYSMLGFWCMWLKIHYPEAFYCAQLQKTKEEHWQRLIKDAAKHGVEVSGVDFHKSARTWTITGPGRISAGFMQLEGVGPVLVEKILAYRQEFLSGPDPRRVFRLDNMIEVKGIGPAMMNRLHAMDLDDPFGLKAVTVKLAEVRKAFRQGLIQLPSPTHTSDQLLDLADDRMVTWIGIPKARNYQDYVENRRSRTGLSVDEIVAKMSHKNLVTSVVLQCFDEYDEDVYVRINRLIYPKLKAMLQQLRVGEDVIVARGKKNRSGFGVSVQVDRLWILTPPS